MKKVHSLLFTFILAISALFLLAPSASAATIDDAAVKAEYQNLITQGVIDPSVDYNTWATIYVEGLNISAAEEAKVESEAIVAGVSAPSEVVYPAYTSMKAGDIFVTNDSWGNGLSGHTAIAISSTAILQMTGKGHSSEILSYAQWKSKYHKRSKSTWIYRHNNATAAQKAADWARMNYWHPNGGGAQSLTPKYSLTFKLNSIDPSYCSLLVWQAYYKTTPSLIRAPYTNIVSPYALQPSHLPTRTLWKEQPKLISTINNYKNS